VARKQVIVQLDDDLVRRLDESAIADGISRSEAIRRAAREYLEHEWEREADRRYAQSYREHPSGWEWEDEYSRMAPEDMRTSAEGEDSAPR
jgi:Arc/MetJ-type ribon-helix-helix transcriptional regulator